MAFIWSRQSGAAWISVVSSEANDYLPTQRVAPSLAPPPFLPHDDALSVPGRSKCPFVSSFSSHPYFPDPVSPLRPSRRRRVLIAIKPNSRQRSLCATPTLSPSWTI